MLIRIITTGVAGSLALGAIFAGAATAEAPVPTTKVVAAQPEAVGGSTAAQEGIPSANGEALPPPAQPAPARKRSFFAGPGLGLLALAGGAGAGAAVASSSDDAPASP